MSKLKDCANMVKCIGTISEILIDFIPKQDNIILKGSIVLHVNDSYIRFNFFTNKKMKSEYYDMIELFGIPYEYIQSIDNDRYVLFEELIQCELGGKIRVWNDKESKKEYVISNNKADKIFCISNINEYGNNITYAKRSAKQCGLGIRLQGVIYKANIDKHILTIVNSNKDGDVKFIELRYDDELMDKLKKMKVGSVCDFNITWDKGYEIDENIVSNTIGASYKLIDFDMTDVVYNKDTIKDLIQLYEIEQEVKQKAL